ncbi:MAG TPA: HD domain-containing protein [Gemmataceae bacterium]|nr:HD domain-containing protein [Gemmataceae bacterium]
MAASNPHRQYEVRCPVHGFIGINDWEREIINHRDFQRLRRIRQLAWTDQVYPGAMHSRFEHSLGVMHMATKLYESVVRQSQPLLESELGYNRDGLERDKTLVRLTALLHDVGHGPFSHAAEELFPLRADGSERYVHEDYSAAIIRSRMRDVIEDHPLNINYRFKVEDITALLEGSDRAGRGIFWREVISGQLDADRMDYLLRDSLHAGVDYGRYDWRRLLNTVKAVRTSDSGGLRLGINEGGVHAAEALVLARYFMFTQVYFHKTRVAFDHHLREALAELLAGGVFPRPTKEELDDYLAWDDWKVLGNLAAGEGGDHGRRLASRDHFREVYHTPEVPTPADLDHLEKVRDQLGSLVRAEKRAEKSWYKVGNADISVVSDDDTRRVLPLSLHSTVVDQLRATGKVMLFADRQECAIARQKAASIQRNSP